MDRSLGDADATGGASGGVEHETPPAAPRWVKVVLVAAALVVLALLVAMVLVPGEHGPSRHVGGAADPAVSSEPADG